MWPGRSWRMHGRTSGSPHAPDDGVKTMHCSRVRPPHRPATDPGLRRTTNRVRDDRLREEKWRKTIKFWQANGVTHFTLHNAYSLNEFTRIEGRTVSAHLAAMIRYHEAVADLF